VPWKILEVPAEDIYGKDIQFGLPIGIEEADTKKSELAA
jgi:hypothetical protein